MTDWKSNKRLSDSLARSLSRHTCDIHVVHGKAGSGNGKKHLCAGCVPTDRPTDDRPVHASADRFHFYGVRTQRAWRGVGERRAIEVVVEGSGEIRTLVQQSATPICVCSMFNVRHMDVAWGYKDGRRAEQRFHNGSLSLRSFRMDLKFVLIHDDALYLVERGQCCSDPEPDRNLTLVSQEFVVE